MKGFFRWFKANTKMKRWLLLICIGIALCCYGIAEILVNDQMLMETLIKIVIVFISGFVCVVYSVVSIQKRTLEILIQDSDSRIKDKDSSVKSLIFNKKIYNQGPNVVVIGGGSGMNNVLKGLKNYTDNITAIVTVSDYGTPKNESKTTLDILPIDDVKESIIALAKNEEHTKRLLDYKFNNGKLTSLEFCDIYMATMNNIYGDFTKTVENVSNTLNITGKVIPATLSDIKICVELDDGTTLKSKHEIPKQINNKINRISRVFIEPVNCSPANGVIEAIKEADAIIIGPGALYTNVIPGLLIKGVAKAIKDSKAYKVYVSNIMTQPGQTDNFGLSDHIKAINEHVGKGVIDYCIYDTGDIIPEFIRKYNMQGSELVEQDVSKVKMDGVQLLKRDLAGIEGKNIRHKPEAVGSAIIGLICDDLKFKDMQNDNQYVLLNDRLKKNKLLAKKQLKSRKKLEKKNGITKAKRLENKTKKSKFQAKHHDRIASIRESEIKSRHKEMYRKDGE